MINIKNHCLNYITIEHTYWVVSVILKDNRRAFLSFVIAAITNFLKKRPKKVGVQWLKYCNKKVNNEK